MYQVRHENTDSDKAPDQFVISRDVEEGEEQVAIFFDRSRAFYVRDLLNAKEAGEDLNQVEETHLDIMQPHEEEVTEDSE